MPAETSLQLGAGAFSTAQLSEPGGRTANEDYCGYLELSAATCWVVADGLGGHHGGALASRTATEKILESFRANPEVSARALELHIEGAHAAIQKLQTEDPTVVSMRTTAVVLVSDQRQAVWAHIGDSRLYRFQSRGLVARTEDHSVPQSLVCAGEITADQIRGHPDRNRLLRSLGDKGPARPTVLPAPVKLAHTDAFVLCTDGFWEYIWETELLADLVASGTPGEWLGRAGSRIKARVPKEHDNYSAVALLRRADPSRLRQLTVDARLPKPDSGSQSGPPTRVEQPPRSPDSPPGTGQETRKL